MEYQLIAERDKKLSAIEQVLTNRGITDIDHYLNTSDKDILDLSTIDHLKEGATMLALHIAKGSKVMVQIDSDCDGYTSAALLINYLNKLFPAFVQNNIYYRTHEGKAHGILLETVPEEVKLVIAPDSSSEDYEVHEALSQRGVDVLVIDHHEAKKVSEHACVINNQLCDYPNKFLSGVGMVYKFCCYLDEIMGVDYADDFLDLVALGMVADMMDLRELETKHLISLGIQNINNPYFRGMAIKNEYSINGEMTPFAIGWYIAPYINAITRSGTTEEKLVLFEAMLDHRAYELIPSNKRGHAPGEMETRLEQACRTCINVKNRQTKARDEGLEIIEKMIVDNGLLDHKILLLKLKKGVAANIAGLMGNQLLTEYQRPVLVLSATDHDGEKWWEGSCRGPNIPGLEDCKSFYESSGLVEYCQGHANAFGIGIRDTNLEAFLTWCDNNLADFDFTPVYKADFIYNHKELGDFVFDFYNLMEYKSIWGQEVSQPYIVIENVVLNKDNLSLMKGKVLKITSPYAPDINFIKMGSNQQEFESLYSETGYVTINLIGFCERNNYNNKPQIVIKNYEVINRQAYYF